MRQRPGPDRIASILREIQADRDAGLNINPACRKAGIASTTYDRWKAPQEDPVSKEQLRVSKKAVRRLDRESGLKVDRPWADPKPAGSRDRTRTPAISGPRAARTM